jgi:hypothetical protein
VPSKRPGPALPPGTVGGGQQAVALVLPAAPVDGVPQAVISSENQETVSKFLRSSVQPSTDRTYELQWRWFVDFMKERGSLDPFMRDLTPQERAATVGLVVISRYVQGKRGKATTADTAAIRLRFSQEMLDTTFLDLTVVSTARSATLLNPEELRQRRSSAPACTVNLPVCEEFLTNMRERLVGNRGGDDAGMVFIMLYTGIMFGYEFAARIGEYTVAEGTNANHCKDRRPVFRCGGTYVALPGRGQRPDKPHPNGIWRRVQGRVRVQCERRDDKGQDHGQGEVRCPQVTSCWTT